MSNLFWVKNLLGAPLSAECAAALDDNTINAILTEAADQGVFCLAYNALKPYFSDACLAKWKPTYYSLKTQNILNDRCHKKLHGIMTSAGIPYVIIKGMASAKYYPVPEARMMGDVDFLVAHDQVTAAEDALKAAGMRRTETEENGFHESFSDGNTILELHWAPPGVPPEGETGDKVREFLSDIIDKAVMYDGYFVPSDFHHCIILLLHSVSHMTTGGMGLRHLCDWAVFADSFSSDAFVSEFESPLKSIGMWEFARVLTAVSVKYLGTGERPWAAGVDGGTIDLLMQDIIDAGNFGVKDDQRLNQAKLMRDDTNREIETAGMGKILFTNLTVRARRAMPITAKVPVLLPIGWAYIGLRHIFRIVTGRKEKIDIKKTVQGAEKRRELYNRLRLFESSDES
ncbi:MAG: nucleotidyltransferase family protein [Saccharofermentans sp.]|nr:nucleotidyltransferase family protein [Saccharofermentans sp.]